ncbi:N-acetylmuramoyl-L-alanine amidase [Geodermatophilus sp. SYSU D00779]
MARMPGALWKPLPRPSTSRMARYDLVVIHTMVGSLAGTDAYFRRLTNGVNSHFGTGGGGEIYQWVDTTVRSGANAAGNHRSVTIENADMGPGFAPWNTNDGAAVPAFTHHQVEAIARICAWAHREHGVPLVAAPNSLPGSRGIAFHRQGIDPWRVPGGEVWSSARGKVCPGNRRVAQIPQIIARARQVAGLDDNPEEDWMSTPISEENLDRIRRAVHHAPIAPNGQIENGHPWAATREAGVDAKTGEILVLLRDVSRRIAALEARLGAQV